MPLHKDSLDMQLSILPELKGSYFFKKIFSMVLAMAGNV